jgi:hypothetical protein
MTIDDKRLNFIWTILNVIDYDIYKEVKADYQEYGESDIVSQLDNVLDDIIDYALEWELGS